MLNKVAKMESFLRELENDSYGFLWLAAAAYELANATFKHRVSVLIYEASATYEGIINNSSSINSAVPKSRVAWQCLSLALTRAPYSFAEAEKASKLENPLEGYTHITTEDAMEKYHFLNYADVLADTLIFDSGMPKSHRVLQLRRLVRRLCEERILKVNNRNTLGTGYLWLSRIVKGKTIAGRGDLSCRARDTFGLHHLRESRLLIMYRISSDSKELESQCRRPTALNSPGTRFRAWSDNLSTGSEWGTTVDLRRLAERHSGIDGVPEAVTMPLLLKDTTFSAILPLGYPGSRRGIKNKPAKDADYCGDSDFRKRIEAELKGFGLSVEAAILILVEAVILILKDLHS